MTDAYYSMSIVIARNFNNRYKNIDPVPTMPAYEQFDPNMMYYLRCAFYYELYGGNYRVIVSDNKLTNNNVTRTFINYLNRDTYIGVSNDIFIPMKMTLYMKELMPLHGNDYDLSNEYTDDFSKGLTNLLSQLNVYDKDNTSNTFASKRKNKDQYIFTLDALFSDYPFYVDSTLSGKRLSYSNYLRSVQQRINNFITQPGHMQIAYRLGLLVPNGYDNQRCTIYAGLHHRKGIYSLIRREISLVYQQINGWSPMDIVEIPITNPLPFNEQSQWCYDAIYALNNDTVPPESINKNVSQNDLSAAFDSGGYKYIHNLSMETICHLTLDSSEAVQAFDLNTSNPNEYRLHSVQFHTGKSLIPFEQVKQTVIRTGTFNPNEIDSTYHMPNCVLKDNIVLNNHKPLLKSERNWTETDKINANLVAHTQTLASVGNNQFLIGIYGDNSKYHWAQAFGLFDLSGNKNSNDYTDISKIPYLIGFNSYRLEATTHLTRTEKQLIVQTIQKDKSVTYYIYDLEPILKSMYKNNRTDINSFTPLHTFTVPSNLADITSYQGFVYNASSKQIIVSSQHYPDDYTIDQDKTICLPRYEMPRALYMIPWQETNPQKVSFVPITNLKNTTLSESINDQTNDSLKPVTYATELEGIQMASDTSLYQLCVYHWSDKDLVKQDNSNILMRFYWDFS